MSRIDSCAQWFVSRSSHRVKYLIRDFTSSTPVSCPFGLILLTSLNLSTVWVGPIQVVLCLVILLVEVRAMNNVSIQSDYDIHIHTYASPARPICSRGLCTLRAGVSVTRAHDVITASSPPALDGMDRTKGQSHARSSGYVVMWSSAVMACYTHRRHLGAMRLVKYFSYEVPFLRSRYN